jgi:hypothetical protein
MLEKHAGQGRKAVTDQSRHGWRTSLIVDAVDLAGGRVPVVTGVIATAGGLQVGMRVDDETTLILPDQNGAQLIVNLREALLAKLQGDS